MTEGAPWESTDSDGWAPFLTGTADRPPLPFFESAMAYVGRDGNGRLAIDLGCGGGAETRAFLAHGWRVFATDGSPSARRLIEERLEPGQEESVTVAIGQFQDVSLPTAELVYAQMSLPFAGKDFDEAVSAALDAVRPSGAFVGHFFGPNDDWIDGENTAAVDLAWIDQRFDGWDDLQVDEVDQEGPFGLEGNTKHWHYYFVMARR